MRAVSWGWMLRYGAARAGIGVHDMFYNAVVGFFLAGYGLPNWAIGFLANERSFLGSLLQPVAGAWSDRLRTRWGRRRPFMLLIIPAALGFLLFPGEPPVAVVVATLIVSPLLLGLGVTAYEVLLPDNVIPEQRGTVNGVNRFIAFLAGIVFLVIAAGTWVSRPGLVFLAVPVALVGSLAVTLFGVGEPPPLSGPEPPVRFSPRDYIRGILQYREATTYVVSYFFYWLGIGGITPFVTRFGHEALGIPEEETFILLLSVMFSTLFTVAQAGWLGDRVGKKRVMQWGLGIFAVLVLVGSQLQTKEQAIAVLILVGVAQAVPTALAYPLFTVMVPARRMGELSGLSTMIWSLAQPLGATFLGYLSDQTGTLRTVFLGGGIALAVSWVILLRVREPRLPAGETEE